MNFVNLCAILCETLWLFFFYHKGTQSTTLRNSKENINLAILRIIEVK
jgi:hypothetical protein